MDCIYHRAFYFWCTLRSKQQQTVYCDCCFESSRHTDGLNIPSELGALASIAGLGNVRIQPLNFNGADDGKEFILKASKTLSFNEDPFFQTYIPNISTQFGATIKKLIGRGRHNENEVYNRGYNTKKLFEIYSSISNIIGCN